MLSWVELSHTAQCEQEKVPGWPKSADDIPGGLEAAWRVTFHVECKELLLYHSAVRN